MNSYVRFALSAAAVGILSISSGLPVAVADDAAKLKELEKALTAAPIGKEAPKKRTRAIVFDNEPQAAAPAEATKAQGPINCSAVPEDAKTTAVGFQIQFRLGSADVDPGSEKILREIAKLLALNPDHCVMVEGHTDSTGNPERNMALSRERANSVVKFISEKAGVDQNRLIPIGKGSSDPEKNLDPRNPQNRRVVFKVVG